MKINLNKEIYSIDAINQAIYDYVGLCKINLEEHGEDYVCTFFESKYNLETTKREFENYLIDLMNCREC